MSRSNRVEPVSTDSAGTADVTRATVTTTTRMEFVRRVQVVPMREALAQLNTDLNQSLGGDVIISPRLWTGMNRLATPLPVRRPNRTIWLVGCIFICVGLMALIGVIAGLTLALRGGTATLAESSIERYDVGDLQYGLSNIDQTQFPANTYLSSENVDSVQKYLSDQLSGESGYRGLLLDSVLVQEQSSSSGRRRRQTSCPMKFIVKNIRIYFDYCSTCSGSRNIALRRALANLTTLQDPLTLTTSSGGASQVSAQICSTPSITSLIIPVRLSIAQLQEVNSTLIYTDLSVTTTVRQTTYSTSTTTSTPRRSSYAVTSRSITTQKLVTSPRITTARTTTRTTTTTTITLPIETTPYFMTTMINSLSTVAFDEIVTSTALPPVEASTMEFVPTSSFLPTEWTTVADTTLRSSTIEMDQTEMETLVTSIITSTLAPDLTSEQTSTLGWTESPTSTDAEQTTTGSMDTIATTIDYVTYSSTSASFDNATTEIVEGTTFPSLFTTDGTELSTLSTTTTRLPTTMKPFTSQPLTTAKGRASTYNPRRMTSVPIIPLVPFPLTSRPRNISSSTALPITAAVTSMKPGLTRKQTGYPTGSVRFTTQRYGVSVPLTILSTFQPKTPMTSAISTGRTRRQTAYTTGSFRITTPRAIVSSPATLSTTITTPRRRQPVFSTAKPGVSVPLTILSTFQPKTPMTSAISTGRTRRQTAYTTGSFRFTTSKNNVSVPITTMLATVTGPTRKRPAASTAKYGVSVPMTLLSTFQPKTPMTSALPTGRTVRQSAYTTGSFRFSTPITSATPSVSTARTRKQTAGLTGKTALSTPVTLLSTNQPKTSINRQRATSMVPIMTTGRTVSRTDTTATQRRGRFRTTVVTVKQTTPMVTTMRPQTTLITSLPTTQPSIDSTTAGNVASTQEPNLLVDTSASSSSILFTTEPNRDGISTESVPTTGSRTQNEPTTPVSASSMSSMTISLSSLHDPYDASLGSTVTSSATPSEIDEESAKSTDLIQTLSHSLLTTHKSSTAIILEHSQPTTDYRDLLSSMESTAMSSEVSVSASSNFFTDDLATSTRLSIVDVTSPISNMSSILTTAAEPMTNSIRSSMPTSVNTVAEAENSTPSTQSTDVIKDPTTLSIDVETIPAILPISSNSSVNYAAQTSDALALATSTSTSVTSTSNDQSNSSIPTMASSEMPISVSTWTNLTSSGSSETTANDENMASTETNIASHEMTTDNIDSSISSATSPETLTPSTTSSTSTSSSILTFTSSDVETFLTALVTTASGAIETESSHPSSTSTKTVKTTMDHVGPFISTNDLDTSSSINPMAHTTDMEIKSSAATTSIDTSTVPSVQTTSDSAIETSMPLPVDSSLLSTDHPSTTQVLTSTHAPVTSTLQQASSSIYENSTLVVTDGTTETTLGKASTVDDSTSPADSVTTASMHSKTASNDASSLDSSSYQPMASSKASLLTTNNLDTTLPTSTVMPFLSPLISQTTPEIHAVLSTITNVAIAVSTESCPHTDDTTPDQQSSPGTTSTAAILIDLSTKGPHSPLVETTTISDEHLSSTAVIVDHTTSPSNDIATTFDTRMTDISPTAVQWTTHTSGAPLQVTQSVNTSTHMTHENSSPSSTNQAIDLNDLVSTQTPEETDTMGVSSTTITTDEAAHKSSLVTTISIDQSTDANSDSVSSTLKNILLTSVSSSPSTTDPENHLFTSVGPSRRTSVTDDAIERTTVIANTTSGIREESSMTPNVHIQTSSRSLIDSTVHHQGTTSMDWITTTSSVTIHDISTPRSTEIDLKTTDPSEFSTSTILRSSLSSIDNNNLFSASLASTSSVKSTSDSVPALGTSSSSAPQDSLTTLHGSTQLTHGEITSSTDSFASTSITVAAITTSNLLNEPSSEATSSSTFTSTMSTMTEQPYMETSTGMDLESGSQRPTEITTGLPSSSYTSTSPTPTISTGDANSMSMSSERTSVRQTSLSSTDGNMQTTSVASVRTPVRTSTLFDDLSTITADTSVAFEYQAKTSIPDVLSTTSVPTEEKTSTHPNPSTIFFHGTNQQTLSTSASSSTKIALSTDSNSNSTIANSSTIQLSSVAAASGSTTFSLHESGGLTSVHTTSDDATSRSSTAETATSIDESSNIVLSSTQYPYRSTQALPDESSSRPTPPLADGTTSMTLVPSIFLTTSSFRTSGSTRIADDSTVPAASLRQQSTPTSTTSEILSTAVSIDENTTIPMTDGTKETTFDAISTSDTVSSSDSSRIASIIQKTTSDDFPSSQRESFPDLSSTISRKLHLSTNNLDTTNPPISSTSSSTDQTIKSILETSIYPQNPTTIASDTSLPSTDHGIVSMSVFLSTMETRKAFSLSPASLTTRVEKGSSLKSTQLAETTDKIVVSSTPTIATDHHSLEPMSIATTSRISLSDDSSQATSTERTSTALNIGESSTETTRIMSLPTSGDNHQIASSVHPSIDSTNQQQRRTSVNSLSSTTSVASYDESTRIITKIDTRTSDFPEITISATVESSLLSLDRNDSTTDPSTHQQPSSRATTWSTLSSSTDEVYDGSSVSNRADVKEQSTLQGILPQTTTGSASILSTLQKEDVTTTTSAQNEQSSERVTNPATIKNPFETSRPSSQASPSMVVDLNLQSSSNTGEMASTTFTSQSSAKTISHSSPDINILTTQSTVSSTPRTTSETTFTGSDGIGVSIGSSLTMNDLDTHTMQTVSSSAVTTASSVKFEMESSSTRISLTTTDREPNTWSQTTNVMFTKNSATAVASSRNMAETSDSSSSSSSASTMSNSLSTDRSIQSTLVSTPTTMTIAVTSTSMALERSESSTFFDHPQSTSTREYHSEFSTEQSKETSSHSSTTWSEANDPPSRKTTIDNDLGTIHSINPISPTLEISSPRQMITSSTTQPIIASFWRSMPDTTHDRTPAVNIFMETTSIIRELSTSEDLSEKNLLSTLSPTTSLEQISPATDTVPQASLSRTVFSITSQPPGSIVATDANRPATGTPLNAQWTSATTISQEHSTDQTQHPVNISSSNHLTSSNSLNSDADVTPYLTTIASASSTNQERSSPTTLQSISTKETVDESTADVVEPSSSTDPIGFMSMKTSTVNNDVNSSGVTFTQVSNIEFNGIESSTSIPSDGDQSSFHSSTAITSARTVPLVPTVTINEHSDEVMRSSSAVIETIERTISSSTVTPLTSIPNNIIQSETTITSEALETETDETFGTLSHLENGTDIASSSTVGHSLTLANSYSDTSMHPVSDIHQLIESRTTSTTFPLDSSSHSLSSAPDEYQEKVTTTLEDLPKTNHDDQVLFASSSHELRSTNELFSRERNWITASISSSTSANLVSVISTTEELSSIEAISSTTDSIDSNSKSITASRFDDVSRITLPPAETFRVSVSNESTIDPNLSTITP